MEQKSAVVIHQRIAIGISACAMGSPVRYNAKGWDLLEKMGREKSDFRWCPVCPECMAGLGVPREPVHLSGGTGDAVWNGEAAVRDRKGQDVTGAMKEGAEDCLRALNRAGAVAFVYMEGSPSCGVYATTLKNKRRGNPPGVFGALLLQHHLFLIPSTDLQSPLRWWDWRRRLLAFWWVRQADMSSKQALYAVWHQMKFLCQELDDTWARETGRALAALDKKQVAAFAEPFRDALSDLLRRPSSTRKITHALWKNYAYFRRVSGKTVPEINAPEFRRNITTIAREMLLMERTAADEKVLFGPSPVIYREKRRSDPAREETQELPAEAHPQEITD